MADTAVTPRTARAVAVVQAVQAVTPHMRRITLGGPDIDRLLQADGIDEPAAWVQVFLPSGEGRAYTLGHLDFEARTLDLDFVLHGAGPATGPGADPGAGAAACGGPASSWASQAGVGQVLGIAGPRSGGFVLADDARWVLLAGDATALPAMRRIAERLPAGIHAKVYAEVLSLREQQPVPSAARLRVEWINAQAQPGLSLCQWLLYRPLPPGPGHIWMAGESTAIRTLQQHYLHERELPRHSVSAKGYWKAGRAALLAGPVP